MATLSELINAVCDDLNRDDLTAQCSDAVVMAIRHFDSRRWWFSEGSATFTTTSTTSAYPLATDFRDMDYMEVSLPGDNWQEVKEEDFGTIRQMLQGQTVTGYPDKFAIYDQAIHLAYQPNDAYQVRYYYTKTLADLTANGSNAWTTDCRDVIQARASKNVALTKLHDPELAAVFAPVEDEAYRRLLDENDRRTSSSKITPKY